MKKITLFLLLSMVIVFGAEAHKYKKINSHLTISIQTFYDQLSPYGDWIYTPDFGYVWRPYFDYPQDFRPYSSGGNWVYTTYGWTWVSDYNWGWATFHYGRWDFDDYLGWMWIPGYEWAPAWVTWGSYNNYWGWAPLGPNIYAYSNSNWFAPDPWWTFVPQNRFCSNNWNNYIYDRHVNVTNITNITNIYVDNSHNNGNHNSWYQGPRVSDVERYGRTKVRTMQVVDNQRPENTGVRSDRLNVYRPEVDKTRGETRPAEYRNVEQARSTTRIQQTNARTNNPGAIRTRESSTETGRANQRLNERNEIVNAYSREKPGNSTQAPATRTGGETRDVKVTPRINTQSEQRNGNINGETRGEPRNQSQGSDVRNSNRPAVEPTRQTPSRDVNKNEAERGKLQTTSPRIENSENRQSRTATTTRENGNSSSARESVKTQTPVVQPSRQERVITSIPASADRVENTVNKKIEKENGRQTETKKDTERPESRTSGNPTRR